MNDEIEKNQIERNSENTEFNNIIPSSEEFWK